MIFIDEIFESIQGEGLDMGLPCIFVRLYGCNIGCTYCDTHQKIENRKRTSVGKIMSKIHGFNNKRVCITGGEPLLQPEVYVLVYELLSEDYAVSIETSGCVKIDPDTYRRSYKYVMDIKCPSSGVSDKNVYSNLAILNRNDEVKFVIGDIKDYEFSKKILRKYPTCAKILYSPVWGSDIGADLVKWLLKDKMYSARVQTQLHKVLGVS